MNLYYVNIQPDQSLYKVRLFYYLYIISNIKVPIWATQCKRLVWAIAAINRHIIYRKVIVLGQFLFILYLVYIHIVSQIPYLAKTYFLESWARFLSAYFILRKLPYYVASIQLRFKWSGDYFRTALSE